MGKRAGASQDRIRRDIPLFPVRSTSISAAGYARKLSILRLRYSGGRTYDYLGVSPEVFQAFLAAPSKGQFVNWRIKPCYPVRARRLTVGIAELRSGEDGIGSGYAPGEGRLAAMERS